MPEKKEKAKKQLLLRLSSVLWEDLAQWAEDDFRSINGQIEYLLTECVKKVFLAYIMDKFILIIN